MQSTCAQFLFRWLLAFQSTYSDEADPVSNATVGSKPLPSVSSPTLSASPSAFAPAAQPSTRRPPPPPPPPPAPLSPRRSTAMVAGQSLLAHSGQEVTHTAPLTDSSSSSTAGQAPQATTSNPSLTAEQVRDLAQRFQEQNRCKSTLWRSNRPLSYLTVFISSRSGSPL